MSTISTFSMSIIGPHRTSIALHTRSGERQSWHLSSILQGVFAGKRLQFCTAAVLRARKTADSKSGQILFVPAMI